MEFAQILIVGAILGSAWISPAHAGPGASGGGNGIAGRPLEAYAVDITQTPEFINQVQPRLQVIEKNLPTLKTRIDSLLMNKIWYLVPVELDSLPNGVLGVVFSSDQMATQSSKAVWISTLHYPSTEEDRGRLLLHEILMGVKLAELDDVQKYIDLHNNDYSTQPLDYNNIRFVTIKVFQNYKNMSVDEVRALLETHGFNHYPLSVEPRIYSPGEIYQLLASQSQNLRQNISSDPCDLTTSLSSDSQKLSIKLSSNEILISQPALVSSEKAVTVYYKAAEEHASPSEGDARRVFYFIIEDGNVLTGIQISWEKFISVAPTNNLQWKTITFEDVNYGNHFARFCITRKAQ